MATVMVIIVVRPLEFAHLTPPSWYIGSGWTELIG